MEGASPGPKQGGAGAAPQRGNPKKRVKFRKFNSDEERQYQSNCNTSNNNKAVENKTRFPMEFKVLRGLADEVSDIEEVILKLSNEQEGFSLLLNSDLNNKPDVVVLITRILNRVCEEGKECHLLKSIFIKGNFLKTLKTYIAGLEFQNCDEIKNNSYFWNDTDQFWNNLTNICRHLNEKYPSIGCEVTPELLIVLQTIAERLEKKHHIKVSDTTKQTIVSLLEVSQKLVKVQRSSHTEYIQPTNDFRELSIYPTVSEITNSERSFHLNANRVEGKYGSIDEYLDVQFRLLREDFVSPLRKGICQYLEGSTKKNHEVRVHPQVQFLNSEAINEFYCYRVQFDKKKTHFIYENSKKFMMGSLLCFTRDNFTTVLFGRISKREIKDLENGQILVGFEKDHELIAFNTDYLMVECNLYFEPYFQVLCVLQRFQIDKFPMKKYIIDVERTIDPPLYVLNLDSYSYEIEYKYFCPLDWPDLTFYGLDDFQSAAFQAALTKEFALIQGPPGTGKTFVGLKIVQTLLNNQHAWCKGSPILIICFTNHALDQFLEGVASHTEKILRIGGESKNENIAKFNINNKIKELRNSELYLAQDKLKNCMQDLKYVTNCLSEINKRKCVFDFNIFSDVIPEYESTWFFTAQKKQMLDWLLAGKETNKEEVQILAEEQLLNAEVCEENCVEFEEKHKIIIISLEEIKNNINNMMEKVNFIRKDCNMRKGEKSIKIQDLLSEIGTTRSNLKYLKKKLEEGSANFNDAAYINLLKNPNLIAPDIRWKLYFFWLDRLKESLLAKQDIISKKFSKTYGHYIDLRKLTDAQLMKDHLVVGMTTTGAARMHSVLQNVKCPIVIVEEAAEVLEAHVISALTVDCQHLILIGDHQQLRPNTADYDIDKNFNLGVSLFERMVHNKIECHTLNVQHRMRPEISALIAPTIYPALQNHDSVCGRDQINGVEKNLYFIDHQEPEQQCETSKKNLHEATFVISLAKYLILNGHEAKQITILATYLGQMCEMHDMKEKYKLLKDVRIAVLDNYQGEESDIILLSLVRSNNENSIGFLKIENRVCVALSRARNGLYIIGNMSLLCANSKIWSEIKKTLLQQDAIGPRLSLVCQVHPDRKTLVSCARDFPREWESSCDLKCGKLLICGHLCPKQCHIVDREHVAYNCLEKCSKLLCDKDPNHKCLKHCYEDCGFCTYTVRRTLKCGHEAVLSCHIETEEYNCQKLIKTTLPCGHVVDKPCYLDAKMFQCTHMCEVRVEPCGHACTKKCHIFSDPDHIKYTCKKKCSKFRIGCIVQEESHRCPKRCFEECVPCELEVHKKRTLCSHVYKVPCTFDVDKIICDKPCLKVLECGHKCKDECFEPCSPCSMMVDKIVSDCGHTVKTECSQDADRKLCKGKCPRKLPCGHTCTETCNEPCTDQCGELVDCQINGKCGHIITRIQCYLKAKELSVVTKYCNAPCGAKLQCGHVCSGTCNECYQGRVHKKCEEKCGVTLICNHQCQFPCKESCNPCQKPCEYKCIHSICAKKCSELCVRCKQPCARRCKHQKCTKLCGDICNVDACLEPCERLLPCGHECVGFCGDPCPKLCRICDKDELRKISDDEGARFVQLDECGHVFENSQLDEWFSQTNDKVVVKVCPKCKTPVTKTFRYSHYLKQILKDVDKIKKKLYGNEKDNEIKRLKLFKQLQMLNNRCAKSILHVMTFSTLMKKLADQLCTTFRNKKQSLSNFDLDAILSKLQILEHLVDTCGDTKETYPRSSDQIDFIIDFLLKDNNRISKQEAHDTELEILRLQRIVQFENIINSEQYKYATDECAKLVMVIENKIFSMRIYSDIMDHDVSNELKQLNEVVSSNVIITDIKKREIVQAVGFNLGHWYKCSNGHVYSIGESKCSECGVTKGGKNRTPCVKN